MNCVKKIFRSIATASLIAASMVSTAGTLADSPLSLRGSVPPNVMFALSVEFPTAVQQAYRTVGTYSAATEFVGLFDPNKCYSYDTINGWFVPQYYGTAHVCSPGEWSGNFLNWSTMSSLDEFRYAMTGGNRFVDTATLTVLERTYLANQGSTTNFPTSLSFTGAGASPFPSVTVATAKKGVEMTATGSGVGVVTCNTPGAVVPNCGTLSLTLGGIASGNVNCTTWSGNGNSGNPFQCASLVADLAATGVTATSTPQAEASFLPNSSADTVSCSAAAFASGAFSCTYTRASDGTTGTCASPNGSGTVGSPFSCSTFDTFGGDTFTVGTPAAASTIVNSVSGTTTTRVPSSGTTRVTCTIANVGGASDSKTITCPLADPVGASISSSTYSGNPRIFSGPWTFSAGVTGGTLKSGPTAHTKGSKVNCYHTGSNRQCYTQYNIAYEWNKPTTVNTTYYYIPSYTGTTSSGAAQYYVPAYDLSLGATTTYNVRVKVCDPLVGLESNCKAFGTSYKPTGVLQDNGDIMKFGVFSYYNSNDIDNAVMRSKAKYVAPQKFASSGGLIANPSKEWSETDGTLVTDPDPTERANSYPAGANPPRSGVINYINKFGRPVDPLPGVVASTYKTYDNIGKLYYETLKYLRGLAPTTDFYTRATAATDDDFPVITNWDDPLQYSCQKNYIIVLGDKNTHCDKRLPGGTFTAAGAGQCSGRPEPDDYGSLAETVPASRGPGVNVTTWTNTLGNLQGDSPNNTRATATTGAGGASWYMSGLAYWAAKNDIRQDDPTQLATIGTQKVKTYIIDVEEGGPSSTSQFAMAAKYGGAESFDVSGNPVSSVFASAADHTGAAFPSYPWPKTLLRASDPAKMITSVRSALSDIAAQIGTESALAQSSGDLRTGSGAYIYRAIFNSGGWIGDVQAFTISSGGVINDTPVWEASSKLPAHGSRRILTYNDGLQADGTAESTANSRSGVVFAAADATELSANFSSRQRALLNLDDTGATDNQAIARVNFLRGDDSNEGTSGLKWRERSSRLGDSVNSNPTFVGAPLPFLTGNGYNTFAASYVNRKPVVYVGSNDGMLHGYDASVDASGVATATAGTEVLAFVPSAVYGNLSKLMSVNYSHKYYVDGTPVISEACFSDCDAATAVSAPVWKTVLAGGLNAGGQGIYALNVTDPANFATATPASLVLWEFTDRDDADLGFTFGKPLIRLMNNGKWAVIFGNGFNNNFADGHASTTSRAYLYIAFVDGPTGAGSTWTSGTDYIKIELKSPTESTDVPPNGLSAPVALDQNVDGKIDYIYAGDRQGNVWKIDVRDSTPSNWASAFGTTADPLPLFTTSDGAATPSRQQITTGIELSKHPVTGYVVMFGTGSYIDITDPLGPFKAESYYGLWDKNDVAATRITSRSQLQKQAVLAEVISGGSTFSVQSNCKPNFAESLVPTVAATNVAEPFCPSSLAYTTSDQQLGWVFDLPNSGERVVSDRPLLQSSLLTFTTLTPATDPCTGNTVGREYNIDYLTGGQANSGSVDINGDRKIDSSDYLTVTLMIGGVATPTQARPSGRRLSGGASDTPVRFDRPPTTETGSSTTTTCADFIPGWGCPSRMGPPGSCNRWVQDVVSNEFLTGAGSGLASAPMKCLSAPSGRLNWRQISQ